MPFVVRLFSYVGGRLHMWVFLLYVGGRLRFRSWACGFRTWAAVFLRGHVVFVRGRIVVGRGQLSSYIGGCLWVTHGCRTMPT
jgi:hypothetical protein